MSFECSPTGSHYALSVQSYSMESAPLEVRRNRFSGHVKATLRKCAVPPDQLEALAADREAWRDVCEEGLAAFDINYDQEAEVIIN